MVSAATVLMVGSQDGIRNNDCDNWIFVPNLSQGGVAPPSSAGPGPIRIGTCAWSFEDWKGNFYPERIAPAAMLPFYARHFPTVEVDSTFYAIPAQSSVEAWAARTPADFRFAAKLPKALTHEKRLRECERETDAFLAALSPLGPKLGVVLVQFSEWFDAKGGNAAALSRWLDHATGRGVRFAVEFRHETWRTAECVEMLRSHGVGLVWNDLSLLERQLAEPERHGEITSDLVYVRLIGDPKTKYRPDGGRYHRYGKPLWSREAALQAWAAKLRLAGLRGREVYVFVNNHYEGSSPVTCATLARHLGIPLELPPPPPEQLGLWD